MHNVWHQNKNFQACEEVGGNDPYWGEKSIEAGPGIKQGNRIKRRKY